MSEEQVNVVAEAIEKVDLRNVKMAQKQYDLEQEISIIRNELNKVPRNELINMYIASLNENIKQAVALERLAKMVNTEKESSSEKSE